MAFYFWSARTLTLGFLPPAFSHSPGWLVTTGLLPQLNPLHTLRWVLKGYVFSCFSRIRLFVTPRTVAHQAPLSVGFPRQECWSGLPCPPPGDLPDPGIEPASPASQADSSPTEPPEKSFSNGAHPQISWDTFGNVCFQAVLPKILIQWLWWVSWESAF